MHILLDKDTKIDKMDDDSSPPLIKACSLGNTQGYTFFLIIKLMLI